MAARMNLIEMANLTMSALNALPPPVMMQVILERLTNIVVAPCECRIPECQYTPLNNLVVAAQKYAEHLEKYNMMPAGGVQVPTVGDES